jgi:hypothetical protein
MHWYNSFFHAISLRATMILPSILDVPPSENKNSPQNEFEAVEGLDPQTIREKRAFEEEVSRKVASDYVHIVWAYGIIWVLFAAYGVMLWRKNIQVGRDVAALNKRLNAT